MDVPQVITAQRKQLMNLTALLVDSEQQKEGDSLLIVIWQLPDITQMCKSLRH